MPEPSRLLTDFAYCPASRADASRGSLAGSIHVASEQATRLSHAARKRLRGIKIACVSPAAVLSSTWRGLYHLPARRSPG
jgi:hypothetical protein